MVSTGDAALEAHRKKKEIDLKAHEMKLNAEDWRQERKEARKTKTKKKRFGDVAALYKSAGSLTKACWQLRFIY